MPAKRKQVKRTSSASSKKGKPKLGTCFTIMPFGGWFDEYYTSVYVPAVTKGGLEPARADDLYRPSTIVSDIWTLTKEAKIVLADLSGKSPNVFYELGLAHALAKPVILVVATMDDVPFDLRALRVLEYDKNSPNWGPILEEKITTAIGEVLANPTLSVPSAFLEAVDVGDRPVVSEQEKRMVMLEQQVDRMRREWLGARRLPEREDFGPEEAEEMIRHYLELGISKEMIADRVIARGAPGLWVRDRIADMRLDRLAKRGARLRAPVREITVAKKPTTARVSKTKRVKKVPVKKKRTSKKKTVKKTAKKKAAKK